MLCKKCSKKDIVFIFVAILLILGSTLLVKESLGRSLFIISSIAVWLILSRKTKDLVTSSIIYTLLVLPFNITYQLPEEIKIFGNNLTLSNSYVNGIFVNYLIPTISILDIGIFLIIFSIIYTENFSFIKQSLKKYKISLSIFTLFLIIQNIYIKEFISLFTSIRLLIYIICFILLISYFKKNKENKKLVNLLSYIVLFSTIVQSFIGIKQFSQATSLGLDYLGESQVFAGMRGSSFIELNGGLYLRAYGTFPHPNILAGYLIFSTILSFILLKRSKGITNYILITNIILCIVLTFFTFSRIGIFLIIFSTATLLLQNLVNKNKKLLSFSPILIIERFTNLITGGDNSLKERIDLIKSSLSIIKDNLLLGIGSSNFVRGLENNIPRTSSGIMILQPVHNIFLLILSEFGLLGFLSFFYLIIDIFIKNIKRISFLGTIILINIIVISIFDHYLISLPQGLVIFFGSLLLLFV